MFIKASSQQQKSMSKLITTTQSVWTSANTRLAAGNRLGQYGKWLNTACIHFFLPYSAEINQFSRHTMLCLPGFLHRNRMCALYGHQPPPLLALFFVFPDSFGWSARALHFIYRFAIASVYTIRLVCVWGMLMVEPIERKTQHTFRENASRTMSCRCVCLLWSPVTHPIPVADITWIWGAHKFVFKSIRWVWVCVGRSVSWAGLGHSPSKVLIKTYRVSNSHTHECQSAAPLKSTLCMNDTMWPAIGEEHSRTHSKGSMRKILRTHQPHEHNITCGVDGAFCGWCANLFLAFYRIEVATIPNLLALKSVVLK